MYRQGEDVTRWEAVVDESGSTERYEFGDAVCSPWRTYDGGDGGWLGVGAGKVRVRVCDRRNKQEVVTASGNCGGSLETGVSTRRSNCVGLFSGWEGQGKVDSSSLMVRLRGKGSDVAHLPWKFSQRKPFEDAFYR